MFCFITIKCFTIKNKHFISVLKLSKVYLTRINVKYFILLASCVT